MTPVTFRKVTTAELAKLKVVDGQLIIVIDSDKILYDNEILAQDVKHCHQ